MYFSLGLVLLLGVLLWLVDGALVWFGARRFRRSRLITGVRTQFTRTRNSSK